MPWDRKLVSHPVSIRRLRFFIYFVGDVVAHQFAPPQHDTYTAIHAEIDAALALLA